jgi:hypothetical protein
MQLADVTVIEAMTGYEEQKERLKYVEERLAHAELQIVEGDRLRKKLHNTILVILKELLSLYQSYLCCANTNVLLDLLFAGTERQHQSFLSGSTTFVSWRFE